MNLGLHELTESTTIVAMSMAENDTFCDLCESRCTVSTHTCTMIPFELYSLRRASEKWDINLCRRVETWQSWCHMWRSFASRVLVSIHWTIFHREMQQNNFALHHTKITDSLKYFASFLGLLHRKLAYGSPQLMWRYVTPHTVNIIVWGLVIFYTALNDLSLKGSYLPVYSHL